MKKEKPVVSLKKEELRVPSLTELQLKLVMDGLRSQDPLDRAEALTEVMLALMPNTPPEKFSLRIKDAKDWVNANAFVFEAIGGLFRYVNYADQNPGKFYDTMTQVHKATANINISSKGTGNITVLTGVDDSPLNEPAKIREIDARDIVEEDED